MDRNIDQGGVNPAFVIFVQIGGAWRRCRGEPGARAQRGRASWSVRTVSSPIYFCHDRTLTAGVPPPPTLPAAPSPVWEPRDRCALATKTAGRAGNLGAFWYDTLGWQGKAGDGAVLILLGHRSMPCLQRHGHPGRWQGLRGLRRDGKCTHCTGAVMGRKAAEQRERRIIGYGVPSIPGGGDLPVRCGFPAASSAIRSIEGLTVHRNPTVAMKMESDMVGFALEHSIHDELLAARG